MSTLNGQIIGQTATATRAVLDRLLERSGITFHQWVALNLASENGEIVTRMTGGLKIDEVTARAAISQLIAAGLLEDGLTQAGLAKHREIRAGIDEITRRLYGDLPAEDLATAGRMLITITERANAALAA